MENNNVKTAIISFVSGLTIGGLFGKVYYEKKYRMKLEGATFNSDKKEETKEEAIEVKVEAVEEEKDPKESSEINKNKEDLSTMAKKVQDQNPRVDYSTPTPSEVKHKGEDPILSEDFEIEPEDFGELGDEDYDTVTLLCLADGNLVYENGNKFEPVEEPQRKIGYETYKALKGTPIQDVLYVRNKRLKIDYEIVRDDRTLNEGMSADDDEDDYFED